MLRILQGIESTDAHGLAAVLRQAISTADLDGDDAAGLHSVADAIESAEPTVAGIRCDHICKPDPGDVTIDATDAEIVAAYRAAVTAARSELPGGIVVEACFSVVLLPRKRLTRQSIVPHRCRNCDEIVGADGVCDCTRGEG